MSRLGLYAALAAAPLRPNWPRYLVLFVTTRCNARCRMCFNWQALEQNGAGDLTLEEFEQIAARWPGLIQLTLSGGEPFLRDDLPEIAAAFLTRSGVKQLTVPTNGLLPERIEEFTRKILRRFPGLPLNLNLSLDGLDEEHDRLRGVPGAYALVQDSLRRLTALRQSHPNLRLGATVVLMASNQETVLETLSRLRAEGRFDRLQVELTRGNPRVPEEGAGLLGRYVEAARLLESWGPAGPGWFAGLNFRVAAEMRRMLIETVQHDRMVLPCLGGKNLVVVDADGAVRPCEILHTRPHPGLEDALLGRLRESNYDIAAVVGSAQARRVREWIAAARCHCSYECALYAGLVFRPGQALRVVLKY